jgi:hypothetical protein
LQQKYIRPIKDAKGCRAAKEAAENESKLQLQQVQQESIGQMKQVLAEYMGYDEEGAGKSSRRTISTELASNYVFAGLHDLLTARVAKLEEEIEAESRDSRY